MSGKDSLNVCPYTKDRATENVIVSVPQTNFTRRWVTTLALTVGEGELCTKKRCYHHIPRYLLHLKGGGDLMVYFQHIQVSDSQHQLHNHHTYYKCLHKLLILCNFRVATLLKYSVAHIHHGHTLNLGEREGLFHIHLEHSKNIYYTIQGLFKIHRMHPKHSFVYSIDYWFTLTSPLIRTE